MSEDLEMTPAGQVETLWVLRDRVRFCGGLDGTDLVVVEVLVPPGGGTPLHRHASPELFRMLSGRLDFVRLRDGQPQVIAAGPGDVVRVPSGAPHGYRNTGSEPAEVLVVLDRSMERFFRELGLAEPGSGPPTAEELAKVGAACARHGIGFVEMPVAA